MLAGNLAKLAPDPPAALCERYSIPLQDHESTLLAQSGTSADFLERLIQGGRHLDAIMFLAHALPKRDAVWWACQCARTALSRQSETPEDVLALEMAEAWVERPDDGNARRAMAAARGTIMRSAGSMAAVAAYFASGNIGTASAPVPPPENLTGTMVAGALLMSTAAGPPERVQERYRACLDEGVRLGSG